MSDEADEDDLRVAMGDSAEAGEGGIEAEGASID